MSMKARDSAALSLRTASAMNETQRVWQARSNYFSAMVTERLQAAASAAKFHPAEVNRIDVEIAYNGAAQLHIMDKLGAFVNQSLPAGSLQQTVEWINTNLLEPRKIKSVGYQEGITEVDDLRKALGTSEKTSPGGIILGRW